jgi:ankyrin repeat protein
MLASKAGNLEIAEYLIEKNANINSTNNNEDTALHQALAHG